MSEVPRFALDAYSYFRYLRFSVFDKLVVSPLSCGILKIIATDAHSYFRYLRFAVLTKRVCLHFPFDAQKKQKCIILFLVTSGPLRYIWVAPR